MKVEQIDTKILGFGGGRSGGAKFLKRVRNRQIRKEAKDITKEHPKIHQYRGYLW